MLSESKMYPPPQSLITPPERYASKHKHDNRTFRPHHKEQSKTAPFFYEYIFQDGRLPSLTEHHPVRRSELSRSATVQSSQPGVRADWQPADWHIGLPMSHPEMRRSRSLRKKVKPSQQADDAPLPPASGTKEKLKRALSLSSVKSRPQPRMAAAQQNPPQESAAPRITSKHFANGSFLVPPTPQVTIATPEASPEPTRSSFASSLRSNNFSNFSQGRSSWASNASDHRDLAFMQHIAQGRLTPSPVHVVERNRDKALARLGITEMPLTPPYTPSVSTAPSIQEQRASSEWRQSSGDSRLDEKLHAMEVQAQVEKRRQEVPQPEERPQAITKQSNPEDEITVAPVQPTPMPRPILRRKTSKFTEHLDDAPKPTTQAVHFSRPLPILSKPASKPDHQRSGSAVGALVPRSVNIPGPRRSESMRTPIVNPGQWGSDRSMVFIAETRSIVAAGSAKLVQW